MSLIRRVLKPLHRLCEPFHFGFEGVDALLTGAVGAGHGEQAACRTHRDHLRRKGVVLFHGCRSKEQLACRRKHARIAAALSTTVDGASGDRIGRASDLKCLFGPRYSDRVVAGHWWVAEPTPSLTMLGGPAVSCISTNRCSLPVAAFLIDCGTDPRIPGWMQLTAVHTAEGRKEQEASPGHLLLANRPGRAARGPRYCSSLPGIAPSFAAELGRSVYRIRSDYR